jgi:hypothetical protein
MIVDITTLPCGCLLSREVNDGRRELVVVPCRPGCRNLTSAFIEAVALGEAVEFREAP